MPSSRFGFSLAGAVLLAALLAPAHAQQLVPQAPSQGAEVAPEFVSATQQWLDDAVAKAQSASASPLRMEVSIGSLDSRLRLAPCTHVEPYIPVGMRLWGRTRLGLRCTDGGGRWNVFLPVTIKAFGPAWVLRDNVVAGTVLTPADAVEAEADWAAEASPVVAEAAQWVGQTASRSLVAGQPLRQSMVKAAQVFAAGAQVRVVAQGPGFEVTSDAQALTPGVVGQTVRLRMDNGRMTTGIVQDLRTVRLSM
ncbi:flagellar basal body P-ring formation chaperone FlgA [Variovorax sp. PAMC 28711]|uniref:flagellar basal body P-ring formation chaperone FlgA n=1 Tax=Variovorax sp. PAMC 28711 TaxID=1795631 RepID=UPI00078DB4CD|nr:flagellar basal body P-ring formation chaperone FlgA [Variovorax sp. PAMC 28711]AMM25014.1 flagellar biosynthesis protein FlgA [Variovorax sp. PAMC 28711]